MAYNLHIFATENDLLSFGEESKHKMVAYDYISMHCISYSVLDLKLFRLGGNLNVLTLVLKP